MGFDNNYDESANNFSNSEEMFESFEEQEFGEIQLDLDTDDYSEQEHSEVDEKPESGEKDSPSENSNYKWTKFEEERVLYVYFKDLAHEPLLTAEQEKEIGAQMKECKNKINKIDRQLKESVSL